MNKKIGRPTKLTPHLQEQICKYIADGNYLITACQAAGISKQTYLNWLESGEKDSQSGGGLYYDFLVAVKRAEGEAEIARVARIEAAGKAGNWLADMTHLERRHPERWGRKDRHQVDISETKEVRITRVTVNLGAGQREGVIEGESRELLGEGDATKQEA